jgi:hypothetical protein
MIRRDCEFEAKLGRLFVDRVYCMNKCAGLVSEE